MFGNPFLSKIKDSKSILICGCGGGFDFMAGIPLYRYLKSQGKYVVLGNLSFTQCSELEKETYKQVTKYCYKINKDTKYRRNQKTKYFPEKHFCQYLYDDSKGKEDIEIYLFSNWCVFWNAINVKQLSEAYNVVIDKHGIDTVIIADGGNDSLMRGDEDKCGTIVEDMTSIATLYRCKKIKMNKKFMLSLGFGIDHYHGCHSSHVLENISNVIKKSKEGYLGCFSLVKECKHYQFYKKSSEYIYKMMDFISIVGSSITSSVDGEFGNYQVSKRTKNSSLYINPLMSIYWCFSIEGLAKQIYFIERIIDPKNKDVWSVGDEFDRVRKQLEKNKKIRKRKQFPH